MFRLNDRKVYIKNGPKSQTINICSPRNIEGSYERVVRCKPARRFTDQSLKALGFATVEELAEYLGKQPNCDVELEPSPPSSIDRCTSAVISSTRVSTESRWDNLAIDITERAIDQLIFDFVEFPYLHRVEHSIHCELFRILKSHTMFSTTYPMKDHLCQCIHKEWPRRGTSEGGNIDLCILTPDSLRNCSFRDFRQGHLRPAIGIEIGLDYKLKHLKEDEAKLKASESRTCFLVHLVRDDITDNFPEVEKFLIATTCKTAYARIAGDSAFVKLVNDSEFREIPRR